MKRILLLSCICDFELSVGCDCLLNFRRHTLLSHFIFYFIVCWPSSAHSISLLCWHASIRCAPQLGSMHDCSSECGGKWRHNLHRRKIEFRVYVSIEWNWMNMAGWVLAAQSDGGERESKLMKCLHIFQRCLFALFPSIDWLGRYAYLLRFRIDGFFFLFRLLPASITIIIHVRAPHLVSDASNWQTITICGWCLCLWVTVGVSMMYTIWAQAATDEWTYSTYRTK